MNRRRLRGWGRGLRRAVQRWYTEKPASQVAYQAVKYQGRDRWGQRDLLRLAHPKPPTEQHKAVFHWMTQGWPGVGDDPHPDEALRLIWAFERAKRATEAQEVVRLIREHRLPREAIPTPFLQSAAVWEALLETEMPLTALIRNLATMTRVGLLVPMSPAADLVRTRLEDAEALRRARVHPLTLLSALRVYARGKGVRSQGTWQPVPAIVDALDGAFYRAFDHVEPTGKRWVLALDVSGSMAGGVIAGIPGLTPREASAALALVTARTEPAHTIVAFSAAPGGEAPYWSYVRQGRRGADVDEGMHRLALSPQQRLDDVVRAVSDLPFGATDCALPMLWALKHRVEADVFVILTDSETWTGDIHPVQALQRYRRETGIPARLIVVAMTASQFSIADPDDAGMLDVVGLDTATPELMAAFARGEL